MASNYVAGVNVEKLNGLIIDINNYAEEINNILINIDDLVDSTMPYLNCSSKDRFKKIHNDNSCNFRIAVKNILSYADDLAKVRQHYKLSTDEVVLNLKQKSISSSELVK